ncbi:hypothetical protein [Novosphingobium taihuense]|uniref:DUF3592 domain-containing protein n=1 Tax=Novosphingobium taihuense TaxID=260085 RepID=A0A7W7EXW0_9SPHN|nr:hypothetical protein [Novosphingobium taihuense]MBB4615725.1 hypothetical protein [Novosphingobium taihuense]TWH80138.1 hypothetical protein IQ25_03822 [Novosphingobium taihuense]
MEAVDLIMAGVAGLVLGLCWCLYRCATLLSGWQVAVAHVWRGGYSDLERLDDFFHPDMSIGTLRGFDIRDGEGSRWIEDEVVFETPDGQRIHAMVGRQVQRSWKPTGVFRIWYDRADPQRVTAYGPGYWLFTAMLAFAALAFIFIWGIDWARTGQQPQWLAELTKAEVSQK